MPRQGKKKPSQPNLRLRLREGAFEFFTLLPAELQHRVWSLVDPAPRTITITSANYTTKCETDDYIQKTLVKKAKATCIVPGLLHACHDSRKAGLRHYKLCFKPQLNYRPVFFNFKVDTLYIPDWKAKDSFYGSWESYTKEEVADVWRVECMALGGTFNMDTAGDLCGWGHLWRLKSLMLEQREEWVTKDQSEAEEDFLDALWGHIDEGPALTREFDEVDVSFMRPPEMAEKLGTTDSVARKNQIRNFSSLDKLGAGRVMKPLKTTSVVFLCH